MYLNPFHSSQDQRVSISPEQGSRFAKEVCDDFNPLHNADSKRFCVPGDLLFALTLARLGLSENMAFKYTGMVGKGVELLFPSQAEDSFSILDQNNKAYLEVSRQGKTSNNMDLIEGFSRAYVAFSGHSFPHILVPLMKQHQVMINPDKPMVIYDSMVFELTNLHAQQPNLVLTNTSLEMNGKRGLIKIEFDALEAGEKIGSGYKTMVLSGLRPYDQTAIDLLITQYEAAKKDYYNR